MTSVWMDGCARYSARGQFLTEVCTLPTHAAYSGSQTSQKVLGLRDLGGFERSDVDLGGVLLRGTVSREGTALDRSPPLHNGMCADSVS